MAIKLLHWIWQIKVSVSCFIKPAFIKGGCFEKGRWPCRDRSCRVIADSPCFSLINGKGRVVDLNARQVIIHSEIARLAFIWGKIYWKKRMGKRL